MKFNLTNFLLGVIATMLLMLLIFVFFVYSRIINIELMLANQSSNQISRQIDPESESGREQKDRNFDDGRPNFNELSGKTDKTLMDKAAELVGGDTKAEIEKLTTGPEIANWNQIRKGMKENEVVKLLGKDFVSTSDYRSSTYIYKYGDQTGKVTFDRKMIVTDWQLPK
ncbi:MAG: hypothetical protein K9J12_07250 [Melioribacteraceae bacterium]|nr:hypothetical protein [Melioribacteraceae bacterium]MCF8265861.1 hypothetical protein [Melioribacteraceae bacterium]MCF8412445.1 hypothetical protein [Melioribacteraceae bacterium]